MKFYREKQEYYYWSKIRVNKLTAILNSKNTETYANCVYFLKMADIIMLKMQIILMIMDLKIFV